MKKLNSVVIFAALITIWSGSIIAATCEIKYDRTACPGKEKISYKKCKGNKTCSKFKEAATIEECRAQATKSCGNKRLNITKSKVITAVFDGKQISTASGKSDFCLEYPKRDAEFNHCSN